LLQVQFITVYLLLVLLTTYSHVDEIITLSMNLETLNLSRLFEDIQTNSYTWFALLFEQVHLDIVTTFLYLTLFASIFLCH